VGPVGLGGAGGRAGRAGGSGGSDGTAVERAGRRIVQQPTKWCRENVHVTIARTRAVNLKFRKSNFLEIKLLICWTSRELPATY
jgi:hypothetical protein